MRTKTFGKERKYMDMKQWETMCGEVTTKMAEYVESFVTPISINDDGDGIKHQGSGSFLEVNGLKYLITNDHVTSRRKSCSFSYMFHKCNEIIPLEGSTIDEDYPVDVSITKIDSSTWDHYTHSSKAIPLSLFASKHSPVEKELLFFIGYSGERSSFHFQYLKSSGTPYLTQEDVNRNTTEKHYFCILYMPDKAISTGKSFLPSPPGMSGSLVWNTRFVEKGMDFNIWKVEDALVTGIVHRWNKDCLKATKVEYLKIVDMVSLL